MKLCFERNRGWHGCQCLYLEGWTAVFIPSSPSNSSATKKDFETPLSCLALLFQNAPIIFKLHFLTTYTVKHIDWIPVCLTPTLSRSKFWWVPAFFHTTELMVTGPLDPRSKKPNTLMATADSCGFLFWWIIVTLWLTKSVSVKTGFYCTTPGHYTGRKTKIRHFK